MKHTFRQSMSFLHTWSGLTFSWILVFMFVTGAIGYFTNEIDRWMNPEIPFSSRDLSQAQHLETAEKRLQQVAPNAELWRVEFPTGRQSVLRIRWETAGKDGKTVSGSESLHPATGAPYKMRNTGGGSNLYKMHYALHYIPREIAYLFTSLFAFFMLIALISGIIIHRSFFKDMFTFNKGRGTSAWLSTHTLLSVLPLPYFLMITYSGLIFLVFRTMPLVILGGYDYDRAASENMRSDVFAFQQPEEPSGIPDTNARLTDVLEEAQSYLSGSDASYIESINRGYSNSRVEVARYLRAGVISEKQIYFDGVTGAYKSEKLRGDEVYHGGVKIYRILTALHEGHFAGPTMRWIYFLSALSGGGMVATGMILWVVKRRKKAKKSSESLKSIQFVEYLNAGTLAGLPIGIAAYFWASRLLPLGIENRPTWELHLLFIFWTCAFIYPIAMVSKRSVNQCWADLLTLGSLSYSLIPLLNILTGGTHIGNSIIAGDWKMAGFDLTALGFGIAFALATIKLRKITMRDAEPRISSNEKINEVAHDGI